MSASFNKIVKNIIDSKYVYRNEFIEPYEPPEDSSEYNVPRNLSHLPTKQQNEIMGNIIDDLNGAKKRINYKIEKLTEKALKEVLSETESKELVHLSDELVKTETRISNITLSE